MSRVFILKPTKFTLSGSTICVDRQLIGLNSQDSCYKQITRDMLGYRR